jgi:zinc/manganese transport system substrate-binding protein
MMPRRALWLPLAVLAWGLWLGQAAAATLQVVASFTILADMARAIGGERISVTSLVGPDGDPHAYEPTPRDVQRLRSADLVIVNGLHLEGWIDRLIASAAAKGKVVTASTGITLRHMTEEGREIIDPHGWNSAANGAIYAETIARALAAADPAGAPSYQANSTRYIGELRRLDAYARQEIGRIPEARRKVLTSHDALGYFGYAYGVKVLAPLGFSTEAEASARDVAALIEQIRREGVRSYFVENSNDSRLTEQIARATGAKPGGVLYVEALSGAEGPAPSYVALFRRNLDLLVAAMKGDERR